MDVFYVSGVVLVGVNVEAAVMRRFVADSSSCATAFAIVLVPGKRGWLHCSSVGDWLGSYLESAFWNSFSSSSSLRTSRLKCTFSLWHLLSCVSMSLNGNHSSRKCLVSLCVPVNSVMYFLMRAFPSITRSSPAYSSNVGVSVVSLWSLSF